MKPKTGMSVSKAMLPHHSVLNNGHDQYDYVDSFQGTLIDIDNNITPADIGKAFFSSGPKWISKLFTLRNKIVSLFGLKTPGKIINRQQQLDNFNCEPGERLGLFNVFSKTVNEVVLGEDDKHLNFRVSLFLASSVTDQSKKVLTISTTVKFNNWFGRLYFLPVRPFHRFIVPTMLRSILKELKMQLQNNTC